MLAAKAACGGERVKFLGVQTSNPLFLNWIFFVVKGKLQVIFDCDIGELKRSSKIGRGGGI